MLIKACVRVRSCNFNGSKGGDEGIKQQVGHGLGVGELC